jgi:hypothetical protein
MFVRVLLVAVLLCLAPPARAQSPAEVITLQPPVWLERAGARTPLRAGDSLASSDILETGDGGRVHVRLSDGSILKLGEGARLTLARLAPPDKPDGVFRGALEVLRGAFRFTTDTLSRLKRKRDMTVRIATLTVGVRGTDLWGRSDQRSDLVCLIEGKIEVRHPRSGVVTLDRPRSFFEAPYNAAPNPVSSVAPEQLQKWAQETEMTPEGGTMAATGGWRVKMIEIPDAEQARAYAERMRASGFPAVVSERRVNGERNYLVSVDGFTSEREAQGFADRVRGRFRLAPER